MDPKVVQTVKARLARAEAAVAELRTANDFEAFEAAWVAFLVIAQTIYNKLEQGAKVSNKSIPWFGHVKHVRNIENSVLRYVHHARNSDEHSISDVTKRISLTWAFPDSVGGPFQSLTLDGGSTPLSLHGQDEQGRPWVADPSAISLKAALITVHNKKHKVACDPPTEHLGRPLASEEIEPVHVAELTLEYLRGIIGEAEKLAGT